MIIDLQQLVSLGETLQIGDKKIDNKKIILI